MEERGEKDAFSQILLFSFFYSGLSPNLPIVHLSMRGGRLQKFGSRPSVVMQNICTIRYDQENQ